MSIFLVFLMWTLYKIFNPEHGSKIFEKFYGLTVTAELMMLVGFLQLAFVGSFGLGLWKKWAYLAVLVLHAGSTLKSDGVTNYIGWVAVAFVCIHSPQLKSAPNKACPQSERLESR